MAGRVWGPEAAGKGTGRGTGRGRGVYVRSGVRAYTQRAYLAVGTVVVFDTRAGAGAAGASVVVILAIIILAIINVTAVPANVPLNAAGVVGVSRAAFANVSVVLERARNNQPCS